ncbi:hypothetical protein PR202_gb00302 [Eleusine coracana subsp. coracana]|uniref:Uncharacterized protein n=1 Tax=Eleusine coracana subsp. coracana TaxID=191504 RepID=A0AAV5DTT8_ELECO|nr:hypothetical protein PR202_gb00302 [Eleusine coracana subsp. coracana]
MEVEIERLKENTEEQTKEISHVMEIDNLKMSVANMEKEREELSNQLKDTLDEKTVALAKLQQKEVDVINLENQLEQQQKKILHMEQTYGSFISDLESKLKEQAKHISNLQETIRELETIKSDLYNEVTVYQQKKTVALTQLQQVETSMKNLESQLEQQLKRTSQMEQTYGSVISELESKLEQQANLILNLQGTNNDLEAVKTSLYNEIKVHQDEKSATLVQLQQVETSMKNHESQLEQQLKRNSHIEQTYGAFISDLERKLEQQDKHTRDNWKLERLIYIMRSW